MRITKFGHACVRVEHDGKTVVIDPGAFTSPDAVDGADAILITHEHSDHFAPELLERAATRVYTISSVAKLLPDSLSPIVVEPGHEFTVAGFVATTVGEMHAVTHPDTARFFNSGFVLTAGGSSLYHPGDALTPPPMRVDVCCVPVSGPWLKLGEAIDFARSVNAPRNLAIHDKLASDAGLGIVDTQMRVLLPEELSFVRRRDGDDM